MVLFTALLVVSMTAGIAVAEVGSQTWFLSNNPPGSDQVKVMYKGAIVTPGLVDVTNGVVWLANESAIYDVPFSGNWNVSLRASSSSDCQVTAYIGVVNGTSFTPYGNRSLIVSGVTQKNFSINATDFTVPEGEYLALRVVRTFGSATVRVAADGINSGIVSPPTDPGYPVPELSTIVLMSVGLLALVGYVAWRRKRN